MEPYLSIVIASPEHDLQRFLTATLDQCRRDRIPSELIIVDREPSSLAQNLFVPRDKGPCSARVIEAPEDAAASQIDIGVRRARGRYVLALENAALIPDEVMEFIGEQQARFNSVEDNDIAAHDGSVMLGKGWYWKEMDSSKPFRWFRNEAEVSIQPYRDSLRVFTIDIEPGPAVTRRLANLVVLDDNGAKLLSARIETRRVVNIPLPAGSKVPIRLRLCVAGSSRSRSSEQRVLSARVMRCGLYELPVAAIPWTVPHRIRCILTRSLGGALIPEMPCVEQWPYSPHFAASTGFSLLRRELWHPGAASDRGLPDQELKETILVEREIPRRPAAMVAVDLIGAPLVFFFRTIPRPLLPEPGAFSNVSVAEPALPPLRKPPKISIVTPSYQQGHYLEWTIRSVLEQDYPNLEYVVMDGGSKDQTSEILARYKHRLAYSQSAPDQGQADAVVRGFAHTSGEIMAYLNSDDLLAPGALDFVARYFAIHPEIDAIYSHRVFIDEGNTVTRYWILPPHRNWMMQRWDYIPQETCFWRRRIYEEVGGIDPTFHFALDYDLFVRIMKQGRMARVNRFLGAFREHPLSKTTQQEGPHPEVGRVQEAHGIRIFDWHRLPQLAQYELLDVRSRKFAAEGKLLPGALPGIGYDYNLVWGGRLNELTIPQSA